jgi:hypothetical protein
VYYIATLSELYMTFPKECYIMILLELYTMLLELYATLPELYIMILKKCHIATIPKEYYIVIIPKECYITTISKECYITMFLKLYVMISKRVLYRYYVVIKT